MSEETEKNIDDVMAYFRTYAQIKACMYIPLNAAIVVCIHQESKKGKCLLPKTLTDLYYALTQTLLLRYLYGHPYYKEQERNIESFEDLSDRVYENFLTICKVAYDGICKEGRKRVQLIFYDRDLGSCETLGFMQSVAEVYVMNGQKMSHNFLHLTVQEFLAAVYISTMSPTVQLDYFQRHKDGRLRVVLRFLSDLTKLNKVTPDQLRSLLGEPTLEQSDEQHILYCNPMRPDVCISAHHSNWLFEAQNSELLQSLFYNHTVSFDFTRGMLQLEYHSVGYCIAHSHSKWLLIFKGNPEEEKVSMLLKAADTGDIQQCSVALKTRRPMSTDNLNILLTSFGGCVKELYLRVLTPLALTNLSALRILELRLDENSDISDFSLPLLESLTIIRTTQDSIATNTKKALHKLLLFSSSIVQFHFQSKVSDESMEEIVQSLCDNTALELKSLEIVSDCTFTITATESVLKVIEMSTALHYLKISGDTFSVLGKGSSDNTLKSLDIDCECTFTTTATRSLVQFITRSTSLQYIRICHVKVRAQNFVELTQAIHHCSRLKDKKLEELRFWGDCSEEDAVNLRRMCKDHPDTRNSIDWEVIIYEHAKGTKASSLSLALPCHIT